MCEDRKGPEVRWVEAGYPIDDGDGVIVVSFSGGNEYRSRVSWHQFIKYHMESAKIIKAHLAKDNIRYFNAGCVGCERLTG